MGLHNARSSRIQTENRLKKGGEAATAGYDKAIESYSPWSTAAATAGTALNKLYEDPSSVRSNPFYQERLNTELESVQNSAAAKGSLFGGNTLLELIKKGGEFASAEFDKSAQRYLAAEPAASNTAEMQIGKGLAKTREFDSLASLSGAESQFDAGMFSSWFGGSGPFGSATAGGMGKMGK